MSQQNIVTAIYTKLTGDNGAGGVATLATGGIYETLAKQNSTMPYVVFAVIDDPPTDYFNGTNDVDTRFQVDIYGKRNLGAGVVRAIADRCYALMHEQSITVTGHANAQTWCIDKGNVDVEGIAYRIMQTWHLIATET